MPVWHARTKEAREAGDLVLIGITQEQHPDRCLLFAQWQGLDWPILWDPFNLTESSVVPLAVAIDEHGIVRMVGMTVGQLDEFLTTSYVAGAPQERTQLGVRAAARGMALPEKGAVLTPDEAMSRLLWGGGADGAALRPADFKASIEALERALRTDDAPAASFRLGVARRLRYDSPAGLPEDFQASLDLWAAALKRDPSQYIWRRRIQQWGPRLDKPYPFYGWIEQAQNEIRGRGAEPVALRVALTSAEVSGSQAVGVTAAQAEHPDPERKVQRDLDRWIAIDVAVVPHTGDRDSTKKARGAQVHLALRPSSRLDVHWNNEAGRASIWIDGAGSVELERSELVLEASGEPVSSEPRHVDFTVLPDPSARILRGTAFYYVCEGTQGECCFMAQDFEIPLPSNP